jgi:hypothetical protein
MRNVTARRCIKEGCPTQPTVGYEYGKAIACSKHKSDNMKYVLYTKCSISNCDGRANYGKLFFNKYIHCRQHVTLNDYNKSKLFPICKKLSCTNPAFFIKNDDIHHYPIHCAQHRDPTDIELIKRLCSQCNEEIYYPSDRPNCMQCGGYRTGLSLFKEIQVKYFLESNNITFIYDKPLSYYTRKFRPDFLISTKFGSLIIEVDEIQHMRRDPIEEISRMIQIHNDLLHVNPDCETLFIRYNPDSYRGLKVPDKKRLDFLFEILVNIKELPTIGCPLGVIKLFYHDFDGAPVIEPLDLNISVVDVDPSIDDEIIIIDEDYEAEAEAEDNDNDNGEKEESF